MGKKRTKTHPICYACNNVSTSKEHVPPKVFFPEVEYLSDGYPDFRKNLITVPSCDDHNLKRSLDDQYTFMVIVASIDANHIAHSYFHKVIKTLERKPNMKGIFFKDFRPIIVGGLPSIAPIVEINRFERVLSQVAKGVFYNHYKSKWNKNIGIYPLSFFRMADYPNFQEVNNRIMELRNSSPKLFEKEPKRGSHPEIFFYQFLSNNDNSENGCLLRMVFYEGFEVIALEQN